MAFANTIAISLPLAALTAGVISFVVDVVTVAPVEVNFEVSDVTGGTTLATE